MKSLATVTMALCLTLIAGSAAAVQLFDFDAQAIFPANVGETAEAYGIIVNGNATEVPADASMADLIGILELTGPGGRLVEQRDIAVAVGQRWPFGATTVSAFTPCATS